MDEKQIEEMAKDICENFNDNGTCYCDGKPCDLECECFTDAQYLHKKGYRKQSEGEWETIPDYQPNKLIAYRHICSVCKTFYKDIRPYGHKYCHEMKDQIRIDVTALKDEERNELAKMLFKCGYGIRLTKERITQNRYKYIIVCEKSV
jgi:hypothetical protein